MPRFSYLSTSWTLFLMEKIQFFVQNGSEWDTFCLLKLLDLSGPIPYCGGSVKAAPIVFEMLVLSTQHKHLLLLIIFLSYGSQFLGRGESCIMHLPLTTHIDSDRFEKVLKLSFQINDWGYRYRKIIIYRLERSLLAIFNLHHFVKLKTKTLSFLSIFVFL